MNALRPATGSAIPQSVRVLTAVAAAWALLYAIYRGYYALGGTAAIPGTLRPGAASTFELLNAVASVVLLLGTVGPFIMLRLRSTRLLFVAISASWVVAVGCVMHALIDMTQRVLSLLGILHIAYPSSLWASVQYRAADLQDLFGNEPWFLAEGLLIGALGAVSIGPRYRRIYLLTGTAVTILAIAIGLLAATGRVPRVVVG